MKYREWIYYFRNQYGVHDANRTHYEVQREKKSHCKQAESSDLWRTTRLQSRCACLMCKRAIAEGRPGGFQVYVRVNTWFRHPRNELHSAGWPIYYHNRGNLYALSVTQSALQLNYTHTWVASPSITNPLKHTHTVHTAHTQETHTHTIMSRTLKGTITDQNIVWKEEFLH